MFNLDVSSISQLRSRDTDVGNRNIACAGEVGEFRHFQDGVETQLEAQELSRSAHIIEDE